MYDFATREQSLDTGDWPLWKFLKVLLGAPYSV